MTIVPLRVSVERSVNTSTKISKLSIKAAKGTEAEWLIGLLEEAIDLLRKSPQPVRGGSDRAADWHV